MAKRIVPFGTSETDELVKRYLARGPINPTDVLGYRIERSAERGGVLTLTLFFQDESAADPQPSEE